MVFFAGIGSADGLDSAVGFANKGRLLVHATLTGKSDAALMERVFRDLRQLREDLRLHPEWLIHPTGHGVEMKKESKKLSIAGSLSAADWSTHIADMIVHLGVPVLFLPHAASEPLITPGDLALEWMYLHRVF